MHPFSSINTWKTFGRLGFGESLANGNLSARREVAVAVAKRESDNHCGFKLALAAFALCVSISAITSPVQAAITPDQRKELQELHLATRDAGKLYTEMKYAESATKVTEIQTKLLKLLESKDAELQKEARKVFSALQRAHGLLELEGAELEPLPSWEEVTSREMAAKPQDGAGTVSFKDDVAPWMVNLCGNCHINNRRGNFSLATYNDLVKGSTAGKVLFPGADQGNRIVELIESGDMPRGGGKLTDAQLVAFRKWIVEGAKFDGPDPAANLSTFAKGVENKPAPDMTVKKATGSETVSFARDIAPILTENCNGCHIAGRQASGNFRMDNFAQMLRGGDSGAVVAGGKPEESLLIKKLKGEAGLRMPAGGRPALSAEKIELISTWIREGATFDGSAPETNISTVMNEAWAAKATHDELFTRRQERAVARWKRVLPNDEPATAKSDQVFVLGNVTPARIEEIQKQIDRAVAQTGKLLGAPADAPLVKGGIAVFVLKSRYDYSEFGKMSESRELPREWQGHWQADPLDVYAVIANDSNADEKHQSGQALQVVSGAYLGSFSGVPTWFAEGVARNLVFTANRKSDPRVLTWQQTMPIAIQKVDKSQTLLEGRLDEESAGLVGMGMTGYMMDRSNRRRFDALLDHLRAGKNFNEATSMTFGTPAAIVKSWIGK